MEKFIGEHSRPKFTEIKEGEAIYYLTEFPINNEEDLIFDIDVNAGNKGAGKVKFTQKFYVEE